MIGSRDWSEGGREGEKRGRKGARVRWREKGDMRVKHREETSNEGGG